MNNKANKTSFQKYHIPWNKGNKKTKKLVCPVCKKVFHKCINKNRHSQYIYCSQECAYSGRSLGFTKRNVKQPYNCKRKTLKICLVCQNKYTYRKKSQKYCSRKCFETSHRFRMLGKKNPAYKNGSSYLKNGYRGDNWDNIRKKVYKRDKYICQDCGVRCLGKRGISKENILKLIQCHHIEDYKINKNNNLNNLITLCLKCHLKRHKKKK